MPEVGALLAAKYRVLSLLGQGGMGSVYRAENMLTGKQVALKWMHPQFATSPDARERLLREARATSKLSHPNVVDVYDVVSDAQTLFLVMELLQGESLRDYLRNNRRPPLDEMISIMLGAMAGVAAAHEQGVIHRDLKPDNIFLVHVPGIAQPVPKVLDFGIAKLAEIRGSTLTQTGAAIGTPVYMSLEQLRGDKDIDIRADVYAFGVMLYEALVGQPPFTAATLSELAIKVATTEAAPVGPLRLDVSPALCSIVDRAVRRDRNQRWPDVPSLMQQLKPFVGAPSSHAMRPPRSLTSAQLGTTPLSQMPWTPTTTMAATQPETPDPQASRHQHGSVDSLIAHELAGNNKPRSNPVALLLTAAAVLAVTAVSAFLLLREPDEARAPQPPTAAPLVRPLQPTSAAGPAPTLPPASPQTPQLHFERVEPETPTAMPEPTKPSAEPGLEPSDEAADDRAAMETETETETQDEPQPRSHHRKRRTAKAEPSAPRERPRSEDFGPEAPTPVKQPAADPPASSHPKNASDLLGF